MKRLKSEKKIPSKLKKAVRTAPEYRPRVVVPKKGKGSFKRKSVGIRILPDILRTKE